MNKSDRVREFLKTNPWSTNNQIAAALGLKTNDVAAITTYGFTRLKNDDRLVRMNIYPTVGRPCFAYALAGTTPQTPPAAGPVPAPAGPQAPTPTPTITAPPAPPVGAQNAARFLFNVDVIEQVAEELSNTIFQKVCEKLQEKLSSLTQSRKDMTPQEFVANLVSSIVQPKLSVLIVGLLPQQAGMIQTEFGENLNLKFWKDGSLGQLKKTAQASDFVLLFTSKISHDATNVVASVNNNVIRVAGGMTTLREKLTEIFCES